MSFKGNDDGPKPWDSLVKKAGSGPLIPLQNKPIEIPQAQTGTKPEPSAPQSQSDSGGGTGANSQ